MRDGSQPTADQPARKAMGDFSRRALCREAKRSELVVDHYETGGGGVILLRCVAGGQ
jgi:hypothetical protein